MKERILVKTQFSFFIEHHLHGDEMKNDSYCIHQ